MSPQYELLDTPVPQYVLADSLQEAATKLGQFVARRLGHTDGGRAVATPYDPRRGVYRLTIDGEFITLFRIRRKNGI